MLTINLEKSLVRNKRKLLTKEEILILDQMNKLEENTEVNDLRSKLGMWNENTSVSHKAKSKLKIYEKFSADRIFHKDDIRKLCLSYGLRFLPSNNFNGELDFELPKKIKLFEEKYDCDVDSYNSYIAAPGKSFHLQKKPVDPLFFVKLPDDYYYLVHKWGKDISVLRWLSNLTVRTTAKASMWLLISAFIIGFIVGLLHPVCDSAGFSGMIFMGFAAVARFIYGLFTFRDRAHPWIVGNDELWNSKYI